MRLQYDEETGEVTEGSIVDPSIEQYDAPVPETKKDKFFNFMNMFGDMFFLNVVFFVTSVPLITLGASFTALYSVTLKMVRKEEGKVVPSYFKAWKQNFIPATKAWSVILIYLYLMYVEYQFMLQMSEQSQYIMIFVVGLEMLLLAFILPLLFPLIARYENTTFNYFRNSLVFAVSNIWVWFRVFISWMAPFLLTLMKIEILYYAWYVWAMLLCSILAYSDSIIIRKLFDQLEAAEQEKAQSQSVKTETAKEKNAAKKAETESDAQPVKSKKAGLAEKAKVPKKGSAD